MTTRTHTSGELRSTHSNVPVTLNGWVASTRNLGGILFFDIRDRYGITQVVVDPANKEAYAIAERFRSEFIVSVTGLVRKREKINPGIATGEIEILAEHVELLNAAETTPFTITDEITANEDLRLKYRYLDLRRPSLQANLILRHKITQSIRRYFDERGFIEVETPVMMKATPEGARDYLVPSRIHHGKFYALPQSPQTYKQLLMVAGLDKYFQIVKCFRDEDLRADRQPEFTQIDVEMSFPTEEVIYEIMERMLHRVWEEAGYKLPKPFPRMSYHDAMRRFGSDKPDTRYAIEITTLNEVLRGATEFKVFEEPLATRDGVVAGVVVPGGGSWTRSQIDSFGEVAKTYGAGGVVWIKLHEAGFDSSAKKFLNEGIVARIGSETKASKGDLIAIIAHRSGEKAYTILGALRTEIAKRLNLLEGKTFEFAPVWILDFPMFEHDEARGQFIPKHHPFTSPNIDDWRNRNENPERVRARAYDVVMNGLELGSGSIRIHERTLQEEVFDMLAISREEQEKKFGFLLNAFRYGAPPHGGMALGIDRITMLLAGTTNIRDVIAFPKTTSAASLMDDAPSEVDAQQLQELHIAIAKS